MNNRGFTPLEKSTDFSRWSSLREANGGIKPPLAQTVRERSSLTGFTLVEILISSLLVSIIGLGIIEASLTANKVYERETALLQLQQQARLAMDAMTSELRSAINLTFNNSSSLVFNTPNLTGVAYYLDSSTNQVIREYPSGTMRVIGNNIGYLNLSSDGSSMNCSLIASKTFRGATITFPASGDLTEAVNLRNE